MIANVDGDLVPDAEATVSVHDRGFRYGDGVFETVRIYNGSPFRWDDHAARLEASCSALSLEPGCSQSTIRDRIEATVDANDLLEGAVRVTVTRGVQPGRLAPAAETDPTVVVTAARLPRGGSDGEPVWDGPATVALGSVERPPETTLPAHAKTCNFLPGILARLEHPNADEVLLRDGTGAIAEGTTSNVFLVRDGEVWTPSTDGPVLPGITRAVVLELAEEAGIPVTVDRVEPPELETADELFLTNTTGEVWPVGSYEGRDLEVGPITRELGERFRTLVEQRHY